ncbi:MAG: tRNA lysidine(34) synthetase TilS [bacterium]
MNIIEKARKTILKNNLLKQGDKIVIGVSGGPDSVALLRLFLVVKEEFSLRLHLAHMNHQLRGEESDLDEFFVVNLAKKFDLPYTVKQVDTKSYQKERRLCLQEGARELRYEFFLRVKENEKANKIALGHNANDQAETVLMRLIKGTGMEGLGGIPFNNGYYNIIRPLIEISRNEILECLDNIYQNFREDSSNQRQNYLRNHIRLNLIPILKDYNPSIIELLCQTAKIVKDENSYLEEFTRNQLKELITRQEEHLIEVKVDKVKTLPLCLQRRIIREMIRKVKGDLKRIAYNHIESVLDLIFSKRDGYHEIHLPQELIIGVLNNSLTCLIHKGRPNSRHRIVT